MIVEDNSALIAALTVEPPPAGLLARLGNEDDLHVPHLLDLEFLNVMRRLVLTGKLAGARADTARDDFALLPLIRYNHEPFIDRIWELRSNVSAYDGAYVALAEGSTPR